MKRNSSIELARIMAIAFILLSHFSIWSSWDASRQGFLNYGLTMIYQPLGKFGAYIFVLITSYFSFKNNIDTMNYEKKQLKHGLNIMKEVWFYSIMIFLITWNFNIIQLNGWNMRKALFPFIDHEYWFVTTYIMLILLIPFLNIVSINLNIREHLMLIFTLLFFDSLSLINNYTMSDYLASFVVVYFIGTFLRKYLHKLRPIKNWILGANIAFVWGLEIVLMDVLFHLGHGSVGIHFTDKLLAFDGATSIFILFLRIKSFHNLIINKIAKTVFAAYLLTDTPLTRHFVWDRIFQTFKFQNYVWVPIYGLICIGLIIVVAFVIDTIRFNFFWLVEHVHEKLNLNSKKEY